MPGLTYATYALGESKVQYVRPGTDLRAFDYSRGSAAALDGRLRSEIGQLVG